MDILDDLASIAVPCLIVGGIPMALVGAVIIRIHRRDARADCEPQTLSEMQHRRSDDDRTVTEFRTSAPLGDTAAFLLATLAGILTWIGWLGWGNHKNYHPGQVIGCVITGLAAVVLLGLLTRWWRTGPLAVALGGLLGFSTAWALDSGPSDSTGLWGVGYMMIIAGGGTVLLAVAAVVIGIRSLARPPQTTLSP
ncbi:hypothetical protein ACTXK0_13080 [Corynebacterium variabile]|uniref:Putative membrane protein n=1 Tax=Corynebacterium variabile (strain DSM 44702 / CIP 107183 / JCM 12073 / NCIMB 30131) TaxID=858619 RepID=G0HB12_CORVD|nr:hypothetical protein [Corynebacterium variabile]AEK36137.1 putative membrane protein [Corynebacterium variabile DSM 44702]